MQISDALRKLRRELPKTRTGRHYAKFCVEHGFRQEPPELQVVDGKTLLHVACHLSERDENMPEMVVEILLAARSQMEDATFDAFVNGLAEGEGYRGWSALHLVCNNKAPGRPDIIRYLVVAEADMEQRRGNGMTPLLAAASTAHSQACEVLAALGADLKAKTDEGVTARGLTWNNRTLNKWFEDRHVPVGERTTGSGRHFYSAARFAALRSLVCKIAVHSQSRICIGIGICTGLGTGIG